MKVFIGADHRGYALKQKIMKHFEEVEWIDVGAYELAPEDDYTTYSFALAENLKNNTDLKGILICGSGVGVCLAAGIYPHVRCGLGFRRDQVVSARMDDDINVLSLAADYTDVEEVFAMIEAFLQTPFDSAPRHVDRLQDIRKKRDMIH